MIATIGYMFRLNKAMRTEFERMDARMGCGSRSPMLASMHIRRSDVMVDGRAYYTSRQYANALASVVMKSRGAGNKVEECCVFVASDAGAPLNELKALLEGKTFGTCRFKV